MANAPVVRSRGLRHVALRVRDLPAALAFYRDLLGFRVVWQPDAENVYLSSGCDNLALHQSDRVATDGALDHVGVIVASAAEVGAAQAALTTRGVRLLAATRQHRDGSTSCYVADPDGNSVQILYEPTLSTQFGQS